MAFLLVLKLLFAQVDTYTCWSDSSTDPLTGLTESITRCRVAGQIVDYGSEGQVPMFLYPDVGSASNGTCWFWRSAWSGWEIITRLSDGSATLGYDSDGVPGGPLNVDVTYPVCISEPVDGDPVEVLAWDLVKDYVHQRPDPLLNPEIPFGLTGADTHVAVDPPPPFGGSIVSPLGQLDVEAWVTVLSIDWGDGTSTNLPPSTFASLSGYPDGLARHQYQTKTCDPPGSSPRCHPDLSAYDFEVRYQWQVRWRVGSGPWQGLSVPDSVTSLAYPVQEVIAVLGAVP